MYYVAVDNGKGSSVIATLAPFTIGAVYEGSIPSSKAAIESAQVEGETETVKAESSGRNKEERKLAIMMMNKKRKRLFDQIMKSRKKKLKEVNELKRKRKDYEENLEQDISKRIRVT